MLGTVECCLSQKVMTTSSLSGEREHLKSVGTLQMLIGADMKLTEVFLICFAISH